jgi:hypothetical protein
MDRVAFQALDSKWLDVIKTDLNFLPLTTITRCFHIFKMNVFVFFIFHLE